MNPIVLTLECVPTNSHFTVPLDPDENDFTPDTLCKLVHSDGVKLVNASFGDEV